MKDNYVATKDGQVWLEKEGKKSIFLEDFSSEVDAIRCAQLLNELTHRVYTDAQEAGYYSGYEDGYADAKDENAYGNV